MFPTGLASFDAYFASPKRLGFGVEGGIEGAVGSMLPDSRSSGGALILCSAYLYPTLKEIEQKRKDTRPKR